MKCLLHRINILSATIVFVALCLLLFAPVAYAQESVTTTNSSGTQITTSTASSQAVPISNDSPAQENALFGTMNPTTWDWGLRMFSALFLSAIGAWAIYRVLLYVTAMQNRYYDITQDLARRGQTTHAQVVGAGIPIPTGSAAPAAAPTASATSTPTPKKIVVKGPSTVTVNNKSADFTAFFVQNDKEILADDTVTWQVIPESIATLNRTKGSTVQLTAKQVGAFDLVVKTDDPGTPTGSTEVHFPVAVIAPASSEITLPFIGEGWGTIILAILFGIIIALLGLSRVLSTELVGTLFGALLGYIFGTASPRIASGSPRPVNPPSPSPTE